MSKKNRTIKQKILIRAPPEEVYEAFVDAKKHAAFTGSKAKISPKIGEEFTVWDGYISGKNIELEKGKRIVQEWRTTDFPEDQPNSKLELIFKKTKNGAEISMIHTNVPPEQADDLAQGWHEFYWKPLKEFFAKRHKVEE